MASFPGFKYRKQILMNNTNRTSTKNIQYSTLFLNVALILKANTDNGIFDETRLSQNITADIYICRPGRLNTIDYNNPGLGFFSWNTESLSTSPSTSTADDRIEFEAIITMTSDAVEGEIYPVGFGIEVDAAEVWVSYFNITANAPSGSVVNPSHRKNQLCLTNSYPLLQQKTPRAPKIFLYRLIYISKSF